MPSKLSKGTACGPQDAGLSTLPSLDTTQSCGRKGRERVLAVRPRSQNSIDRALGIIKHSAD